MSSIKITRTIRCLVTDERFKKMLESVLHQFPDYVEICDGKTFKEEPDSIRKPKLIVKAYVISKKTGDKVLTVVNRFYKKY